MRKLIYILLSALLVLTMFSCKKGESKDSSETTGEKNYISYDELEYKSSIRFNDGEMFTFSYDEGQFVAETNKIVGVFSGGVGFVSNLDGSDMKTYSKMKTPFGVEVGDKIADACKKSQFDTGYAAYITKTDGYVMYEKDRSVPVDKDGGGCLYVGYGKDGNGQWGYMDYGMLQAFLQGGLIRDDAEVYDVVVYSYIYNGEAEITSITQIYGNLNTVMAYISQG